MPESLITLFPHMKTGMEWSKYAIQNSLAVNNLTLRTIQAGADTISFNNRWANRMLKLFCALADPGRQKGLSRGFDFYHDNIESIIEQTIGKIRRPFERFGQERCGELEFLKLFTDTESQQNWEVADDRTRVLLDLPGMKLIDVSTASGHRIGNYTVVFAPRAGHHSNIAERVAFYMRDQGLTRMAIVEQKCARDIPLTVNGQRHYEDFQSQVVQYRRILEHLKNITGHPPHLVAVCQPGPLLMATLILNPTLGRTFGSAGSPMHTEAERGFLTDFARMAGKNYIDRMIDFFGRTIGKEHPGSGRRTYDGRLHVLGFYVLGMQQHYRNLKKLLNDLKSGNHKEADRQKAFYLWYNHVLHFPEGFIRDTFKQIFIDNALIKGRLQVGEHNVGLHDYPENVPVWAIGGLKDNIAPSGQATAHMDLIDSIPAKDKLTIECNAGHMGLFRSSKILKNEYSRVVKFMLDRSDK